MESYLLSLLPGKLSEPKLAMVRKRCTRCRIALDKYRTLGITIRIETRKCDRTELKSARATGNFEIWGIGIAIVNGVMKLCDSK